MMVFFEVEISQIQLTLTAFTFGFACFQLVCGPLADRFGRKPILVTGILICCLACYGTTQVTTINELIALRLIQGMASCCIPVACLAVIRDCYEGSKAAKAIGYLTAIMALGPTLAPLPGGYLAAAFSWQSIFWLLTVYGLVSVLLATWLLPETSTTRITTAPKAVIHNYLWLLKQPRFITYTLVASLLYSGLFTFIVGSSFVLINYAGVAQQHFGYWFLVSGIGYVIGNLVSARLAHLPIKKIIIGGVTGALLSGAALSWISVLEIRQPLIIIAPMIVFAFFLGISMPNIVNQALQAYKEMAATAAALFGTIQMALSAAFGFMVGITLVDSPLPMGLFLMLGSGLSLALYLIKASSLPTENS